MDEQLPGPDAVLEIDVGEFARRMAEVPDELTDVLRAFDGERTIAEVRRLIGGDVLVTSTAIHTLFFAGFLRAPEHTTTSAYVQVRDAREVSRHEEEGAVASLHLGAAAHDGHMRHHDAPNVLAQFTGTANEPIMTEKVPTEAAANAAPVAPILADGRVPLAVVQLKRAPAISESSPPAVESEEPMKPRGKRRAAREIQRSNVIPLRAGLRDDVGDERVERSHGERSTEQLRTGERISDYPLGADHHDEDDHGIRDFFAKSPKSIAPSGEPWLDFEEDAHEHEGAHPPHHRGMYWTLGILGAGLLLIGAFLFYNKVLMPTPEDFTVRRPVALPTPDMLPQNRTPGVAEPTIIPPSGVQGTQANAEVPSAEVEVAQPAAEPVAEPPETVQVQGVIAQPLPDEPAAESDYATKLADARKLGMRKNAEQPYLQAIAMNPGGYEALSGLAMLYLNLGRNQQARERAEQALAMNDTDDQAWIVLGAAHSALGKEKLARDAYTRCAALPSGKYVAECKRLLR